GGHATPHRAPRAQPLAPGAGRGGAPNLLTLPFNFRFLLFANLGFFRRNPADRHLHIPSPPTLLFERRRDSGGLRGILGEPLLESSNCLGVAFERRLEGQKGLALTPSRLVLLLQALDELLQRLEFPMYAFVLVLDALELLLDAVVAALHAFVLLAQALVLLADAVIFLIDPLVLAPQLLTPGRQKGIEAAQRLPQRALCVAELAVKQQQIVFEI